MLAKSDVIIRYKCYLWKRLKSVFRQNSELVGGDARARVFVSSRLSIVGSTGITTSKLHKRSDSPSQAKEWNLTELFDTISANPCECHRRLQGWKKEGNERTMDVKQKGRAVEILLHFSKYFLQYTLKCWDYDFLSLLIFIYFVLRDFETWESWNYHWIFHRSDQYFLCSMEFLRIPNFFYLIFSFFSWKVLGAFKGFTWTHSRPRGESTPKDETIPERSGVRGDEASCDILAPSSKIVSFERIADERGYYSQGCERWIVEARDKRQWKVDTIMRLRYCEWFWDDIWVDRLRPPEWKYAIHSRIQNNAAAAAAAVCINNDKIYT